MGGVCTGDGPCVSTPVGTGLNWVTKAGGDSAYVHAIVHALIRQGHGEQDAERLAHGILHRWASGGGNVTAATRARAARALAHWEEIRAKAHGSRQAVLEASSAGDLLPRGPIPQPPKPRQAKLVLASEPHAFRGRDLASCGLCGKPATDPVHTGRSGSRHAGPAHEPVPTGHVKDNPVRRRLAAKREFITDCDQVETKLHAELVALFDKQEKATLSRLKGNRGKRMLRAAQGDPDPAHVFDFAFWVAATVKVLQAIGSLIAKLAATRVAKHLSQEPPGEESLRTLAAAVEARANQVAEQVTGTTFNSLAATLQEGLAAGEPIGALADRVSHVFDVARSRAETIARTTAVGALNQSAYEYALTRPADVVGRKTWLAHHDARTRPTHRVADTQTVALQSPFYVGGWPMLYPGDPTAPPDEVCNCRCSLLFLPAERVDRLEVPAAA